MARTVGELDVLVRQLQGRAPAAGIDVVTFAAGVQSATTTVKHGLGKVPVSVVAVAYAAPAFGKIVTLNVFSFDATSFQVNGEINVAHTGNVSFCWMAVALS